MVLPHRPPSCADVPSLKHPTLSYTFPKAHPFPHGSYRLIIKHLFILAGYYNVAPPGQAPTLVATGNDYSTTPSGQPALILRTDVSFSLVTPNGFPPDAQLAFSNALRKVFAVYNFMSISTTGFQVFPNDSSMKKGIARRIKIGS